MSSVINFLGQLSTTLSFSITFGTVILFGALGEILTEKGGNLTVQMIFHSQLFAGGLSVEIDENEL